MSDPGPGCAESGRADAGSAFGRTMIREYRDDDLVATAAVWLSAGQAEYHYLPEFQMLSAASVVPIFSVAIRACCEIRVFESDGDIAGFIAMKDCVVDRLYVDPPRQNRGIGSTLLSFAKRERPGGLTLFTHRQNYRARAFYEKHGFIAVGFGLSPAPESMPDVEYQWKPEQPAQG